MHVPSAERVQRWLHEAASDVAAAELLAATQPHLGCFHAQQAVERSLKALLTRVVGDPPQRRFAQDLLRLMTACGVLPPDDVVESALATDEFYIAPRYPDALGYADAALMFGARAVRRALGDAHAVLAWVTAELERLGPATPQ